MKTIPAASEYVRSLVACGGGRRLRLKGTSGAEGRRIFMDSLHVNRRPSGDGVVRLVRGIPQLRIVRAEHLDGHAELLPQETEVLAKHRELVDRAEPVEVLSLRVPQIFRDLLRECGDLLRAFPHSRLRQDPLHQDVHRDGPLLREVPCDALDLDLPRWRGVDRESFRGDPGDFQDLPEAVAGEIDPRAEAAEALLQSTMADIREILKVTGMSAMVDWRRASAASARGSISPATASGYRELTTNPSPRRRCQISSAACGTNGASNFV